MNKKGLTDFFAISRFEYILISNTLKFNSFLRLPTYLLKKVMECLFTRRELRLLDDLLPETKKNVRKGMIGQISRISKHNMAKDWHADDLVIQREALKIEMDRAKKHLKKKAKELGLELESVNFKKETKIKSAVDQDFNLSPPSPEKRQRKSSWEKRSKGSKSKGIPSSSSRSR